MKRGGELILPHLRAAKDLMDRSFGDELDLDVLARCAGYSRYHFLRAFREAYGETPRKYLERRRIERARDLLDSANLTVTEVCNVVGYSSLGSFSARFKTVVGCSPIDYRKRTDDGRSRVPGCVVMMWTRLSK
jgi:AraC-like DNA-binding protein